MSRALGSLRRVGRRGPPAGTSADALLAPGACRTDAAAFTASGRTDLLLRVEDRDLFLAECPIWKGRKSLTEKLEQLFGGATSAAVRLALFAFVPERAFLWVVRAGREALEQQPEFQAWVGGQPEGELRYQLTQACCWSGSRPGRDLSGSSNSPRSVPASSHTLIGLLSRPGATTLGRSAAGAVRLVTRRDP